MRDAAEQRKRSNEHLHEAFELINAQKDLQTFINYNSTGGPDMLPPGPVFRHYITNEKVPSTDALFQSSNSSSNLVSSTSLLSINSDTDQSGEVRPPPQHQSSEEDDEPVVIPSPAKTVSATSLLTRKPSHRSSESLNSDESPRKKNSLSIDDKKPSVKLIPLSCSVPLIFILISSFLWPAH